MQQEIKDALELLGDDGRLVKEGWARFPYWRYDRSRINAPWFRIKEWDYYAVLSPGGRFGLTFTISDLGYAGLYALCFLDFSKPYYHQVDTLSILPRGATGLSPDSDMGGVGFRDPKLALDFSVEEGRRILSFKAPLLVDGKGNTGLEGEITLSQDPDTESTNIATSWAENRKAFYYNRKINCMPAEGSFTIGTEEYRFNPQEDMGVLDWGRGRWTYKNRWYWSSASGRVDGVPFGWNLGYGFSDRSPATENTLLYGEHIHKLQDVTFHFDRDKLLDQWHISSSDGRFEMDFNPILDRTSNMNLGLVRSDQHQVFGEFSGTAILDDGTKLRVENFLGFAEDVYNQY